MADPKIVVISAEMKDPRGYKRTMSVQCSIDDDSEAGVKAALADIYPHHELLKVVDVQTLQDL